MDSASSSHRKEEPMDVTGYPKEIFPQGFDSKLICNSCNNVLKDPVQSYCGHRFCKSCIVREMNNNQQVQCKTCIEEGIEEEDYSMISKEHIFPDNALRREMFSMEAICLNPGCTWKGKFKLFEQHCAQCKYKQIRCSQCQTLVAEKSMKNHLAEECCKRPIRCQYCKSDVPAEEIEIHKSTCPKFPVQCDHCGKKKLTRDMLQAHIDKECTHKRINCPAGCDAVERIRFSSHIEQKVGMHIQFIFDSLDRINKELQERTIQRSEILDLKNKLGQIQREFQNHTGAVSEGNSDVSNENETESIVQRRCQTLELKVGTFEGIVTTLHREIERCLTHLDRVEATPNIMQQRILTLERTLGSKDVQIAELQKKLIDTENVTYDGEQLWRIDKWQERRKEAIAGTKTSIFSSPFYTSRHGYKLCTRLYPNGDGMGRGTHVSIFFVVMRGNNDPLLQWPFKHRVTFTIIDQNREADAVDSFRPDPSSNSFKRPITEMNIASGCPLFIPLTKVQDHHCGYVKDDVLYLKTNVTLLS